MGALTEPFFYCLLASMIWAPAVLLTALHCQKKQCRNNDALADKIWPAALMIAALPAFAAPVAAALGLSLRAAPAIPPMAAPVVAETAPATLATVAAEAPAPAFTLTQALELTATLYFYGFLMFLALGVVRHVWFAYRVRYAYALDDPALEAAFEAWRKRIGVKRRPRYAYTDIVSSVCVHGFFRPVVLMPETLLERVNPKEAALMVAHEMAHIKRGDTFLFAFCTGVKAVFWFNPFIQHIAARANLAAEQAADALVIASGAGRRQYAQCFVRGLRFAADTRFAGRELVPSFTPFDRRSRRERLDAILSGDGSASTLSLSHKIGLTLSIAAAAGLAFAQAALAVAPRPVEETLTQPPVEGKVTATFGQRSIRLGAEGPAHQGVDIKAERGALVRAAGDGVVMEATQRYRGQAAWGKVVVIDHGDGLVTRYAHLDSYLVRDGETVDAGDIIGAVGSTGTASMPHLHFEVIQDGALIDPMPLLIADPMPAPEPVSAPHPAERVKPNAAPIKLGAPSSAIFARQSGEAPAEPPHPPEPPHADAVIGVEVEALDLKSVEALTDFKAFEGLGGFEIDVSDLENVRTLTIAAFGDVDVEPATVEELRKKARDLADQSRRAAERAREVSERERKRARAEAQKARERAQREREHAARTRERAQEEAERAREQAQEERERARDEAERKRERAERETERRMERAEREAERARDRAEREIGRAIANAERQAERALERAEREWRRRYGDGDALTVSKQEMLALRAEAIKEIQQNLNKELAIIERSRAELER